MNVEVRLFATLRGYLPAGSDAACARLEMPQGARLNDVLERLGIPAPLAQLIMVDGLHQPDRQTVLHDGTVVSIFPPIAGGVS
jgi:molybdopterin synthase sulfur carrier subunit